jgi:hypothetical protein
MMRKNNYQQLANEITEFCKQRLQTPQAKINVPKSLIHILIAAILAISFGSGDSPDAFRKTVW